MPGLLLLIARDLLLHDPPRVLAWRILHEEHLAAVPAWLAALLPSAVADLDRDPVALLLGAVAVSLAAAYALAALLGARPLLRGAIVVLAAAVLVVLPSAAFITMGGVTGRPYGQDGGVVQLPLALDKVLAGESPYGADYSDSILGKEARASDFWAPYGGNPILHHHAYLPGTHLLMLPFYLLGRGLAGAFDARLVTLIAFALAAFAAARLAAGPAARLAALAVVLVNPLVYWHQIFGANDVLVVALVLMATLLAARQRPLQASVVLGLACATKQLAWPFAPFLLVHLAGLRSFEELLSRDGLRRLARPVLAAAAVFLIVVAPVAALDLRRFWGDIVVYNVGLPGADNYPLGGTPGFGFANVLIYCGAVSSLRDYFPFGVFYALLVPLGLLLLRRQMRSGAAATALLTGSAALLASLYFSRVVHPNYLVIPAILLPIGLLAGRLEPGGERRAADLAVVPLLLLAVAVEVADHEVLRTTWEQALAVRLPQHVGGFVSALLPRAGPSLTQDPLGLIVSAIAAGLAVAYLLAGLLLPSPRVRLALIVAALAAVVVAPTCVVVRVGEASGIVRGQHPWLAAMVDASRRAGGVNEPTPVREAWSMSFRRDPPGVLEAELLMPAGRGLASVLATLRLFDPRRLLLLALAAAAALLFGCAPAERPLALGAALLAPLVSLGLPFGAPDVLLVAGLLAAWALLGRGAPFAAGIVLGAAAAHAPLALAAAPFFLLTDRDSRRGLVGLAAGLTGVSLAGWWLAGSQGPNGSVALDLSTALPIAVGVAAWVVASRLRLSGGRALAAGGTALLLAVALALAMTSGLSVPDLATPAILLLVSLRSGPAHVW